MENRGNGLMVGTLLVASGAILGAGVALLLAPKSGKETRRDIARFAVRTGRKVEGVVGDITDGVSGMVEAVGNRTAGILDKGKDLTLDTKREILDIIEDGQKKLEKQRIRLEKLIA